tara:strand:+ start:187 stop:345 length:159 start_codon:yes stop_codon:yes gene_type:complete
MSPSLETWREAWVRVESDSSWDWAEANESPEREAASDIVSLLLAFWTASSRD